MSVLDEEYESEDESGYGAAEEGDLEDAPGEPPSDEELEQDNYANTDEEASR